jgi:hypothetical protein
MAFPLQDRNVRQHMKLEADRVGLHGLYRVDHLSAAALSAVP